MLSDRILFIDDEPNSRQALVLALESYGLHIDVAGGPMPAQRLVEGAHYAVIAVSMKSSHAALDLLRELGQLQPHAVCALVTESPDAALLMRAINDGAVGAVIVRPWKPDDLVAKLKTCLEAHVERAGRQEAETRIAALHRMVLEQQRLLERSLDEVLERNGGRDRNGVLRTLRDNKEQLASAGRRFFQELAELDRVLEVEAGAMRTLEHVSARLERGGETSPEQRPVDAGAGRREHERVPLVAEVAMEQGGARYGGICENVSVGGMFVATEATLRSGDRLALSFELPGAGRIDVIAEAVWQRAAEKRPGGKRAGWGLRFLDLAPEHAGAIGRFIELWGNESLARLERLSV